MPSRVPGFRAVPVADLGALQVAGLKLGVAAFDWKMQSCDGPVGHDGDGHPGEVHRMVGNDP